MESSIKINFKKSRKGNITKIVQETYLREDVPTPFLENVEMDLENKTIFILDSQTFLGLMDLVENCPVLNNVLVLQTVLEEIKAKDQKVFETVKNLIEIETHRNFQVFANDFSKFTHVDKLNNETWQIRNQRAVMKAIAWYSDQAKLYKKEVLFLTNNFKNFENAKNLGVNSQTIYDFVKEIGDKYPNLLDYVGFTEDEDKIQNENEQQFFPAHLSTEEAVNKIKKGELFEGKLNISRTNKDEGTVMLGKYGFEIKVIGQTSLNRALNGDRVCVELLPENEWKHVGFVHFDDADLEDDLEAQLIEDVQEKSDLKSLIEKIKNKNLTPCGKIVAVIKRVGRSFCGQLDPLTTPRDSNDGFEIREFIPADGRFPHILLRVRKTGSLDTKKIIVKIDSWNTNSKLPKGHFVSVIGEIGDERTEGDVILLEHNVEIKQFSKAVYDCLPPKGVT